MIKDFWKVPTSPTGARHIGCAATPQADNIVGLSTDGGEGWYFHQYRRKGTGVTVETAKAADVLGFKGSLGITSD